MRAHFKPNGWVRIDGEGTVTLTISKSEMGQGVRTSLAMILADELGADWSRIKIVQASPSAEFKDLGTGGSGSNGRWLGLASGGRGRSGDVDDGRGVAVESFA